MSYLRTEFVLPQAAPHRKHGFSAWVLTNLFATWFDSVLTITAALLIAWIVPPLIDWTFLSAAWHGSDRAACATISQGGDQPEGWSGACWPFVTAKFQQFLYGSYSIEERWRVILAAVIFAALLVPLMIPRAPYKAWNAIAFFGIFPVVAFFLLVGGWFGLKYVGTSLWGGLLVTLVLSFVGISVSLPLGILLAIGRRSKLVGIKLLSVVFIETVRGVPLITVLFMANVMLPLFLPPGAVFDKFLRALVAVALFSSAYMAEVIRGGLQAIPKGQAEGAESLGLGYWQTMGLIVLPQALKLVIPGIVNTFIGLFKDTSLVSVIGMFDLLGIVRQSFSDPVWASPQTPMTGLIFAASIFWLFCFGMSRFALYVEDNLDTGHASQR